MRRIAVAIMGTLSTLVLLFSYHTSTNSPASKAAAAPTPSSSDTATSEPSDTSSGDTSSGDTSSGDTSSSDGTTSGKTPSTSPSTDSSSSAATGSGTFTGETVPTRWGDVQVQITVVDGKVTKSEAVVYPQDNPRDVEINDYALPVLAQEAVQAQSAQIDAVSGATVTSDGYIGSLQSALDKAHL